MKNGNIEKMLIEVRKGIVIGLLLISFYGIGTYVYKNQAKNKSRSKIEIKNAQDDVKKPDDKNKKKVDDTKNSKDKKRKKVNDHVYKWSYNEKSTFTKRSLGYEKRFSKTTSQKELDNGLKEEYCNAVKEIKKVDQKIVPGTNIPFKKATEAQIEDAYKEYLQKIAQIRQIVSIISPDDLDNNIYFETRINCYYKGTYWNNANKKKYLARDFYSEEVNDYYK